MNEELSLIDIFRIVWARKKLVFGLGFLLGTAALGYAFLTPPIYKATCRILPPNQDKDSISAVIGQMSGLASLAGLLGTSTNAQLMIGLLKDDVVVDVIIDRFSLMELYEVEYRLKMREMVIEDILLAEDDPDSGIVGVSVLDEDPVRAADMANAFVEELQKKLKGLALSDAAQRRLFFEDQLKQSQKALAEAEDAMLHYQQSSGIVVLGPQMSAILEMITNLRGLIAAKNVEISALRTYARPDNPMLKQAQSQLEAMNRELKSLEEQQKKADVQGSAASDAFSSMGQAPEAGLEYQRFARELRYAAAMYEVMLKQFEAAKLDEAKDFSTLQIVGPAEPPDYKFKPKRALIIIGGTLAGVFLGACWAIFANYLSLLKGNSREL